MVNNRMFMVLIFSGTSLFCSLPPDYPGKPILRNPGHHNHWTDVESRDATPESTRQPTEIQQPLVQQENIKPETTATTFVLPIRAFGPIGASSPAPAGPAMASAAIVLRIPSYRSLSGPNSPTTESKK